MKKIIFLFMILSICVFSTVAFGTEDILAERYAPTILMKLNSNQVVVDGIRKCIAENNETIKPKTFDHISYVPLRFVFDTYGGAIQWVQEKQQAIITYESDTIVVNVKENSITTSKGKISSVPIHNINGCLYVPVEPVFHDILGFTVYTKDLYIMVYEGEFKKFDKEFQWNIRILNNEPERALMCFKDNQSGLWGFVDISGNVVIPPQYDTIEGPMLKEGYVGATKHYYDEKGGFIESNNYLVDEDNDTINLGEYHAGDEFDNGWILAVNGSWINHKFNFFNRRGEKLYVNDSMGSYFPTAKQNNIDNNKYSFVGEGKNGVFYVQYIVEKENKDGTKSKIYQGKYVDENDNIILDNVTGLEPRPNQLEDEFEIVTKDNKFGFINYYGSLNVPIIYKTVLPFSEDLAGVKKDYKYGFIDKKGNMVIEPQYEKIHKSFHLGVAMVQKGKKTQWINKKGEVIIEFEAINEYDGLMSQCCYGEELPMEAYYKAKLGRNSDEPF